MRRLDITRWPALLVFLLAGVAAVLSAFGTVNLFEQTMANIRFLTDYGLEAVELGALWQLLDLTLWGVMVLACFLCFKICETELVYRYRAWTRPKADEGKRDKGDGA